MKTNIESLVKAVAVGIISDSSCGANPMIVGSEGTIVPFFGTGGVSINVSVGDSAFFWAADHIEPGVSLVHTDETKSRALNNFSCVGNTASVVQAAMNGIQPVIGNTGIVTGKHGGAERVLVWFDQETIRLLTPGDMIRIETHGFNMILIDYPEVFLRNMSPELLSRMPCEDTGKQISVGVSKILPGFLMASGLGTGNTYRGDVDIQTSDPAYIKEFSLSELCLGDIVGITDYDATYGASMRKGAATVGVVVHGTSRLSGHGPGVIPLITTSDNQYLRLHEEPVNLADLFHLRK